MTLVRAPDPPLPRFDHRVATEPGPPKRPTGTSGGRRRSTAGDTSHPGGRSPSGRHRGRRPTVTTGAAVPRMTFPAGRVPIFPGHCRSSPTGMPRALVQWRRLEARAPQPKKGVQAAMKPDAAVRRLEKRSRPNPQGVVASVSAPSRRKGASARQKSGSRAQTTPVAAALTPAHRPRRLSCLAASERYASPPSKRVRRLATAWVSR